MYIFLILLFLIILTNTNTIETLVTEDDDNIGSYKILLNDNDKQVDYELVSYSQLSLPLQKEISINYTYYDFGSVVPVFQNDLPNLELYPKYNKKYIPLNDLIFAIPQNELDEDINHELESSSPMITVEPVFTPPLVDNNSIIAFNKKSNPLYLPHSLYSAKNFQRKSYTSLQIINNYLVISSVYNPTVSINDNNISGHFIRLVPITVFNGEKKIYLMKLTLDETNITMSKVNY